MINSLNWLGACEHSSSIHSMRNWLASVDELVVKKQASWGVTHIILDNMDIYIRHLHNLTLPILMFELFPTFHLPNNDEKTLREALEMFGQDLIDLNSDHNINDKEHFLDVVFTVLVHHVCKDFKGLEWMTPFFEKHHKHQHSYQASTRSVIHVDPPIALDEKKLTDMTKILQQLMDRYLSNLAESLDAESKEEFLQSKKKIETLNCSEEELFEAKCQVGAKCLHYL